MPRAQTSPRRLTYLMLRRFVLKRKLGGIFRVHHGGARVRGVGALEHLHVLHPPRQPDVPGFAEVFSVFQALQAVPDHEDEGVPRGPQWRSYQRCLHW